MSSQAKRDPAEITRRSAAHIAKYLIGEMIEEDDKKPRRDQMPTLTNFALKAAINDGGGIDEIAKILYDKGLFISIDKSNPEHAEWLQSGAAEVAKP